MSALKNIIRLLRAGEAATGGERWLNELWVPLRSEMIRLPVDLIERITAERDYVRLHVGERSHLLHRTLTELERRLDPASFVRLHRSAIVRRAIVTALRPDGAAGAAIFRKPGC